VWLTKCIFFLVSNCLFPPSIFSICNFNRHYAEHSTYFTETTSLEDSVDELETTKEVKFYDSNTGKLLFTAPKERTWDAFVRESQAHGWPSFRDAEVNWETVRCLKNGESVSVDGTHLGHNLPDGKGNRYCINLVSIAGRPTSDEM
jgi:peptide methionine sulfoxide reductase MsrB